MLQEILIKEFLKFDLILVTNWNIFFAEYNSASFNRIDFFKVDNERTVDPHKFIFGKL